MTDTVVIILNLFVIFLIPAILLNLWTQSAYIKALGALARRDLAEAEHWGDEGERRFRIANRHPVNWLYSKFTKDEPSNR